MNPYLSLATGALVGVGLVMMIAGWWPASAKSGAPTDVDRSPGPDLDDPRPAPTGGAARWWHTVAAPRLIATFHLSRFAADLALLGETPASLAARKVAYAVAGLALPVVGAGAVWLAGAQPPVVVPTVLGLVLGGVLFVVPDTQARRDAAAGRQAMRAAAGVFLELVALERAADAGATEALDRAAQVGSSPQFARIRDALLRAELAGQPAWSGLTYLADRTGVVELGDVADIMRLSAADGAAVYTTLRARAASLRTQLLTAATAKANAASEHMIVPVALLGIAFMALLGYPAFAQILFG